jgi:antitoxin HicB
MKHKILKYDAVFEAQKEGGYTVTVPSLPGCISEGDTLKEAKENIAEAITVYIESLLMDGESIPKEDNGLFVKKVMIERPTITV